MRITKNQLRQIIKEELAGVLDEETWLPSDPPQLVPDPDYGQEDRPPVGSEGDVVPLPLPGETDVRPPGPMPGGPPVRHWDDVPPIPTPRDKAPRPSPWEKRPSFPKPIDPEDFRDAPPERGPMKPMQERRRRKVRKTRKN